MAATVDVEENAALVIRQGNDRDIPALAKFVADWMYPAEFPAGQRRELTRLGQADLRDRYGARVGQGAYPSAVFVAEVDKEIIGCVGLDCQVIDSKKKKLIKPKWTARGKVDIFDQMDADESSAEIGLVLANLAIRVDQRKKGYGKLLVDACSDFAIENGFSSLYLMVDEENIPAQKLYKKLGYKLLFRDEEATRIVTTITGLRTQSSVNLCFKKNLSRKGVADKGLGGLFSSLFGGSGGWFGK